MSEAKRPLIERCREVVGEAVAREGAEGLLFSGGLDSSIIAALSPSVKAVRSRMSLVCSSMPAGISRFPIVYARRGIMGEDFPRSDWDEDGGQAYLLFFPPRPCCESRTASTNAWKTLNVFLHLSGCHWTSRPKRSWSSMASMMPSEALATTFRSFPIFSVAWW